MFVQSTDYRQFQPRSLCEIADALESLTYEEACRADHESASPLQHMIAALIWTLGADGEGCPIPECTDITAYLDRASKEGAAARMKRNRETGIN